LAPYTHSRCTARYIGKKIDLPVVETVEQATACIAQIGALAAAGKLALDEANDLVGYQKAFIEAKIGTDLEQRMLVIEQALQNANIKLGVGIAVESGFENVVMPARLLSARSQPPEDVALRTAMVTANEMDGAAVTPVHSTLEEFVRERFLPHVRSYKRSWRTDESLFRVHVMPMIGSHYLDTIHSEDITAIIQRMRSEGYANGTTNHVVVALRHLFNLANKWQIPGASNNPTSGMKLAPEVNRERFLTVEEVERLIASIERDENRIAAKAIMLLLLTGARRNEITHAKWENLDPEKRTLLVPLSKSGKPRLIALNSAAVDILQSMPRNADSPYIFPAPTTGRPSPSLHFPWTRIRVRAGLPDLRLHDLRHSFASFLVNKGVSLYVVQGLLGHSHSRYTQRYAHLASETLLDAAESLGDVLLKRRLGG
jgi:integrase